MKNKRRTIQIRRAREAKQFRNSYLGALLLSEALSMRRGRGMQNFA